MNKICTIFIFFLITMCPAVKTLHAAANFHGLSTRFNLLAYGVKSDPETESIVNNNNQSNLTSSQACLALRPDFEYDYDWIYLSIKPRWTLTYEKWTEGANNGETDTSNEFYINEWLARFMITDELFVSYGQENLQWGPSFMISPSNPFIQDNGRDNPMLEVDGLYYGRLAWIPHYNWSASLIVNTDEGRHEFDNDFKEKYALKVDYTGYQKYFSLILSHEQSGGEELGLFAGWWVSEAVLLYGEGSAANETVSDDSMDMDLLAGVSISFKMGPVLAFEYYYNENGFTGPFHEAFSFWGGTANTDDMLFRKNYGLIQLSDSNIGECFGYVLRWTQNFDDSSSRFLSILEYEINNNYKLFYVGEINDGNPNNDEFVSMSNYSIFLGIELTY